MRSDIVDDKKEEEKKNKKIKENKRINEQILKLWGNPDKINCPEKVSKKDKKEVPNRCFPLLFPKFNKEGILFIGLNPSLSEKGVKKIKGNTEFMFIKNVKSFKWWPKEKREQQHKKFVQEQQYTKEFIQMCNELIEFEELSKEKYDYFKKFRKISEYVFGNKRKWEHIDLFFYRTTSQDDLKKCIHYGERKDSDGNITRVSLNEFGKKQLEISLEWIDKIKPKVIVVANAMSSKIIRYFDETNKRIIIDDSNFEKEGFHRAKLSNDNIPIFFTSMLGGQRALDLGSFERLKWQIKKAVGK